MNTYQLELSALKRDWIDDVTPEVVAMLPSLGEFTSDDLHDRISQPEHCNWYGVLMASLKNQGKIELVGTRPSKRAEANGRRLSVWRSKR